MKTSATEVIRTFHQRGCVPEAGELCKAIDLPGIASCIFLPHQSMQQVDPSASVLELAPVKASSPCRQGESLRRQIDDELFLALDQAQFCQVRGRPCELLFGVG